MPSRLQAGLTAIVQPFKQPGDLFAGDASTGFLRAVIEGAKRANFVEPPHRIQRIEKSV